MPFVCSVPQCSNKRGGHIFPRESDRLQQWLRAMRMESYVPTKHSRVCRNHFTDDDYELPKDTVLNDPRPILKSGAVPSVFPWIKGKVKKITSYNQTQEGTVANQSGKNYNITNYHFKNKPEGKTNEKAELKIIPLALKLPESQEHNMTEKLAKKIENTGYPYFKPIEVKEKEVIRIPLTMKTSQHCDSPISLQNINDMDFVICENALKLLSCKFKTPTLDKFPISSYKPHANTLPNLPPDVTITPTRLASKSVLSCFAKQEDNVIKNKHELGKVEIEIDCNLSQISIPIQCNLCDCSKSNARLSTEQNMKCNSTKQFCIQNLMDVTNPAEVQFFTGFKDYEQFKYVFELLGEDVNHFKNTVPAHNLRPCDEFLLTLVKLRRNKLFIELGFKFGISKEQVGFIFTTWINFLYNKFKEISKWMSKDVIDRYMKYGKGKPCVVIIECAGIQLKVKELDFGKHKYTTINANKSIKVFVEMTEAGNSNYVSEALPGSLSDGELIRKCSLDAKSNLNGTESTSSNETDCPIDQPNISNTKKIEKVIGLSKLYTILNGKMDYMLVPIANQIVFVCFMLTNFVKRPKSEKL